MRCLLCCLAFAGFAAGPVIAAEHVLAPRLHHLRNGDRPEWSDFPPSAEAAAMDMRWVAKPNAREAALRMRQQDVRQAWKVFLNGKDLGRLHQDDNDMVVYFAVPPQTLRDGVNALIVQTNSKVTDDIRVGAVTLFDRPVQEILSEATVEVEVRDGANPGLPLPCRLTIVDADGALATVGAISDDQLAVRPGVIYTPTGKARFGLPAGQYTVYAGRGFEYGVESTKLSVKPGDTVRQTLTIRREVDLPGYVSGDTHVHTLTHSGHGDCTLPERMLTIAGEGVELPIATDHNKQIDYEDAARKHGVRRYFTPVVGNEVTTSVGHFNVFPAPPGGPVPDFKLKNWDVLAASISKTTAAKAIILNHGRDVHSGFRPFGTERFISLTGEDLDGWALPANAMEVVNSGAQQSDVMRLVHDWFGLLNRGRRLTPVGSSDSHDVSRYIVGQGRTYLRSSSTDPGAINVQEVIDNFVAGRVLVSCGLLVEISVNDRHGPGDVVRADGPMRVAVRVRGPSWVKAHRVELFVNGVKVKEHKIEHSPKSGVLWEGVWQLKRPSHDMHLVAVATGPAVKAPYWPIARPYQPTSRILSSHVIGTTGAVWIDANGDGRCTSAFDYAKQIVEMAWPDVATVVKQLPLHDRAVALQTASVLRAKGADLQGEQLRKALAAAPEPVRQAFDDYAAAWRASQVERIDKGS